MGTFTKNVLKTNTENNENLVSFFMNSFEGDVEGMFIKYVIKT